MNLFFSFNCCGNGKRCVLDGLLFIVNMFSSLVDRSASEWEKRKSNGNVEAHIHVLHYYYGLSLLYRTNWLREGERKTTESTKYESVYSTWNSATWRWPTVKIFVNHSINFSTLLEMSESVRRAGILFSFTSRWKNVTLINIALERCCGYLPRERLQTRTRSVIPSDNPFILLLLLVSRSTRTFQYHGG